MTKQIFSVYGLYIKLAYKCGFLRLVKARNARGNSGRGKPARGNSDSLEEEP